jgi:DNA modification methylase
VSIGDKNKTLYEFQKSGIIKTNIKNDTLSKEDLYKVLKNAMVNVRSNMKEGASYYVCAPQGGGLGMMMMMMMMKDSGLPSHHNIIWLKSSPTFSMGRLDYDYEHEPIIYGWIGSHKFLGGGKFKTSTWNIAKPQKCDLHPTMKPVELIENAILNSCKENELILDPFGGSGSTIIAAEKTGRICRMMELDPHYCDVIRRRYTKWCRENGGRNPGSGALD